MEGEASTLTLSLGWRFVDGNGEIFESFYFSLSKGMKEEENVWKIFLTLESSDRQFLKFSREEISLQSNWQKLGIYHPCISTSSTYEYIFIRERVKQGVQDRRLIIYQANS